MKPTTPTSGDASAPPMDATQHAVFEAEDFLTRLDGALACLNVIIESIYQGRNAKRPEAEALLFAVGQAPEAAHGLGETLYPSGYFPWQEPAPKLAVAVDNTGKRP